MEAQVYTGFNLGQKKTLKEQEKEASAHITTIQKKLGEQWKIIFLWEEISKNVPADRKNDVGVYFYDRHLAALSKEIDAMDSDVVEALNEAVGANKTITLTIGVEEDPAGFENGGERCRFEPLKDGVKMIWNPSRFIFEYPYSKDYNLNAFVLKNC